MNLEIPEDVVNAMLVPPPERKERILAELAVALYAQEVLSFAKSRDLAGMTRLEFGRLLARRGVDRGYDEECLAQDLEAVRRIVGEPDAGG